MERASKFERELKMGFFFLQKKRIDEKNCSCFLSVKKETCFYWGKSNIQLALSFSKFLHFYLVGGRKAETVFALRL